MATGSQAQAHFLHWLPGKKEEGATSRRGGCSEEDRQAGWGPDLANLRLWPSHLEFICAMVPRVQRAMENQEVPTHTPGP